MQIELPTVAGFWLLIFFGWSVSRVREDVALQFYAHLLRCVLSSVLDFEVFTVLITNFERVFFG